MPGENNFFEALKKIPYLDRGFLEEIKKANWMDPAIFFDTNARGQWPPVNIIETDSEVLVTVQIPGLSQASDMRVELKGNSLKLEGVVNPESKASQEVKVHLNEVKQGKFSRTVTLPAAVQNIGAAATYRQGILEIHLKKLPGSQGQTLPVQFR